SFSSSATSSVSSAFPSAAFTFFSSTPFSPPHAVKPTATTIDNNKINTFLIFFLLHYAIRRVLILSVRTKYLFQNLKPLSYFLNHQSYINQIGRASCRERA